jgi:streptogramin lyase
MKIGDPPIEYSLGQNVFPQQISNGPDGALWFTYQQYDHSSPDPIFIGGGIGRVTTAGVVTKYPLSNPSYYFNPTGGITTGSDGALWFGYEKITSDGTYLGDGVGRITTTGAVTEYALSTNDLGIYSVHRITSGPDGALWAATENSITRITTTGSITVYPINSSQYYPVGVSYITVGPDDALWFTEQNTNAIGRMTTSGDITQYPTPTANSSPCGMFNGPDGNLWFTEGSVRQVGRITVPPAISAPTNLAIASPTQNPALSWNVVSDATSYNVYRNGTNIGSSTTNSYTDSTAPEGTDTYYVTAVNAGGESVPSSSVTVLVDRSPPIVSNVSLATDPISTAQTTTLSANVTDSLSGVSRAEYYTGTDPGAGNGTAMNISSGVASATVGPYFTPGMYTFYVRSQDNAGNWSQPTPVTLDVYSTSAGYTAGHGFVTPNGSTSNPGDSLPTVSGNNVKAAFDFTVKYASSTSTTPTGQSTFTWGSGNCKKANNSCFVVNTDALAWLLVPGDNTATFQGTATLSLNGASQGSNYPVRVSVTGTTTTSPGHYELQVFQVGTNPDTATPIYQASGDLSGGAVVLHQ